MQRHPIRKLQEERCLLLQLVHMAVSSYLKAFYGQRELKKNANHERFLAILSLHLGSNNCNRTQPERWGLKENRTSCYYNTSSVYVALWSCHLLSLPIEENRVFPETYLLVLLLHFQYLKVFHEFRPYKSCDSMRNPFGYSQNWCSRNTKSICCFYSSLHC